MQFESRALSDLFYERLRAIRSFPRTGIGDALPSDLILPVLRLAESVLRDRFGAKHYEISVWTTPETPKIIAYYDSARQERPRTDPHRATNPTFYRDQRYEVIRLLDNPDSERIEFLARLSAQQYQYLGPEQQARIKSSILYCFDQARPAAIVVTSNDPKAFTHSRKHPAEELVRCLSVAIRADLELLDAAAASRQPASHTGTPASLAYSWIHLSDIHFGAGSDHHQADQRVVSDAILRDLPRVPRTVDRIFITGDIAFKGASEEYATAATWIRRLATTAGVDVDRVRLVPGNHDVQRNIVSEEWQAAAAAVRSDPLALETQLRHSRQFLLPRLAGYADFVRELAPGHPKDAHDWVGDWVEDVLCQCGVNRLSLRIAGLSTVWVSDEQDGGGGGEAPFTANMALALSQLELLGSGPATPDLVFLLTHHPPEWLSERCRHEFARALTAFQRVHLCGHIHKNEASLGRAFGLTQAEFRFTAGAAHDEDPKRNMYRGEHGYSWGVIRLNSNGEWELGWAPRVYVPYLNSFRPDHTRFNLDESGFAWERLANAVSQISSRAR